MQRTPPQTPRLASQPTEQLLADEIDPPPPLTGTSPPFEVLVSLFVKLQNERKPDRRKRMMAAWFNRWRQEVGNDLYPILRLLLPQNDRERAVYGLKEKNLAKIYIQMIPLDRKSPDAIRLMNWKKPADSDKAAGDFPTVLYEVISKRLSSTEAPLTVEELNDALDKLCASLGKQEAQKSVLTPIFNKATPEEQRWIARIILKDMNIMVKENSVLSAFHPDALDLYHACSDIKKVAWALWDPNFRLKEEDKEIRLFRSFAPMLCRRPARKIEISVKDMKSRTFLIEEKLDGERIQLHKRGNEYRYLSRKGKDYTYLYGQHVGKGNLTSFIDKALDSRVNEIILDGEMLVYDPVTDRNLPFGTLKTAALDKSKANLNPRPCFKIFDLLYLNGMALTKKSLKFRKRNLHSCFKEQRGRVETVKEYEGKTADDVRKKLEEVMESRGEGLILKHPDSRYVLNGRNQDWIKVKPEYMDDLGETVDVLVVGGHYGSGKRGGNVSTLICALFDDRLSDDDEPKYSTFVRIGSGISYADYAWIRQKPWKEIEGKNLPSWYQHSKKASDDVGDCYLETEDSFLLRVKAAEIIPSEQYHLGFTMRFPRAVRIRDDLDISSCATVSEILEDMKSEKKRKVEGDDTSTKKKRKVTKQEPTLLHSFDGSSLKLVQVESDIFADLKFAVYSDPKSRTGDEDKMDLLRLIRAHGGSYRQFASGREPLLVIYGGASTRMSLFHQTGPSNLADLQLAYDIKLIKDKDKHDIVKPKWIQDCVAARKRVPLTKKYFVHATSSRVSDPEYNLAFEMDAKDSDGPISFSEPSTSSNPKISNQEPEIGGTDEGDPPDGGGETVDSETDPESDYDEDREEEADEWPDELPGSGTPGPSQLETLEGTPTNDTITHEQDSQNDMRMGEDDKAMEYDQELIFKHLCFYLDTPENAVKNGMTWKGKHQDQTQTTFSEIEGLIKTNGGRIGELDDSKLTHLVLDRRDVSRRKDLMKRTSIPRRRHLVITDYISACLEEKTLLDEDSFTP